MPLRRQDRPGAWPREVRSPQAVVLYHRGRTSRKSGGFVLKGIKQTQQQTKKDQDQQPRSNGSNEPQPKPVPPEIMERLIQVYGAYGHGR